MTDQNCEICREFFNVDSRIPYSFICCGETVCKLCCEKFSSVDMKYLQKCPNCKEDINKKFEKLKPLKGIMKQLQNKFEQKFYCQEHSTKDKNYEIVFFCKLDRKFGCRICQKIHKEMHPDEIVKTLKLQEDLIELDDYFYKRILEYQNMSLIISKIKIQNKIWIQQISNLELQLIEKFPHDNIPKLKYLDNQLLIKKEKEIDKENLESYIKQNLLLKNEIQELQNTINSLQKEKNQNIEQLNHISHEEQMKNQIIVLQSEKLKQLSFKVQVFEQNEPYQIQIGDVCNLITTEYFQKLKSWLKKSELKMCLIYRGSKNGYDPQLFHQLCDNQGPTLTVLKSELNQIFGGYAALSWKSGSGYIGGSGQSFLFSLSKSTCHPCLQPSKEIYGCSGSLCIFGAGFDLHVYPEANRNQKSYSNLGLSYQANEGDEFKSVKAREFLAGAQYFKVEELEVFKVFN